MSHYGGLKATTGVALLTRQAKRTGITIAPRLEPFLKLIEHGPRVDYGSILRDADIKGPLTDTRIWVDDVNGDGKLDILVGDMVPLISPADGLSEAEFKKRGDEWTCGHNGRPFHGSPSR